MKNNRKNFLINPKFQLSYLKHSLFLAFAVLLSFYASTMMHFQSFMEKGMKAGLEKDHIFFKFLENQKESMNTLFVISAVVSAIIILAYGIFLSHRVAGPIYRLKKFFETKAEGDHSEPLKFREGDYFSDLADSVNKYLDSRK